MTEAAPNTNFTPLSALAFVLLGAIWGSAFLFIRVAVFDFPPFTLVTFRLLVGAIIMLIALLIGVIWSAELRSNIRKTTSWKLIAKMCFMGFWNNAVPFVLVAYAELSINSGVAAVLDASIPLFGLVFAHFAEKDEKMTILKVFGLLLGFGGVICVCLQKITEDSLTIAEFAGYIAVTGAAAAYALASVFARKYLAGVNGLYLACGQITSGLIMCAAGSLVVDLWLDRSHWGFIKTASWFSWVSIAYLSVVSTGLAYVLYFYLIRTIGSVKQTLVGYLLPVFGVFEGALFLAEWEGVEWWYITSEVLGAALICAGIGLVSFPGLFNRIAACCRRRKVDDMETSINPSDGKSYSTSNV